MAIAELDNLVRTGRLKTEPATQEEVDGLVRSGHARLNDARHAALSTESRFDLAYNGTEVVQLADRLWAAPLGRVIS